MEAAAAGMLDSRRQKIDVLSMRRLMLLRHAKAERAEPSLRDFDRALAPEGRDASPRIGAYMAGHALTPDLVICSSARRAKETWELASGAFSPFPRTTFDKRVYDLDAAGLLDLARKTPAVAHALMLVGHNPSLEDLAALTIANGDLVGRGRLSEKFPPGALAVIDFPFDAWEALRPHSGRFDRLVTPRDIAAGTD
jgi:phosphohistidine phosphatase